MIHRSRFGILVAVLVLLIPVSLPVEGVPVYLGFSGAGLEGRWTSSERAPLGGGLPAAAYDSASDRIVLFGDIDGYGRDSETWTFDYNTNTWTDRRPATRPPSVRAPAMAYDTRAERIVLFGGYRETFGIRGDASLGETWTYDFDTNRWENRTRIGGPPPRSYSAMAYDAESDRTILVGGWMVRSSPPTSVFLNDTWAYEYAANTWSNLTTALRPPATLGHALIYRSSSDRTILVGASPEEVWSYDYNANVWANRAAPGGPLVGNRAVYDSESNRIVSYGQIEVPALVGTPSPGTWVYDADANAWTRLGVLPNPSRRVGHVMAYDAESDRVILFGGVRVGSLSRDTWAYDTNTDTWRSLSPAPRPPPRSAHAMAYDEGSDRMVMFGGEREDFLGLNDTWSYDVDTDRWAWHPTSAGPKARSAHTMIYDSESRRTVLFGGFGGWDSSGAVSSLGDTWTYALGTNTWVNATPTVSPPPRFRAAMAYDAESDRAILFGGWHTGSDGVHHLPDTWAYDLNTNTWVNMTPLVSPAPESTNLAAYDAESDRVVLVIGTLGGDHDDTWTYDFNSNTWTNMTTSSSATGTALGAAAYDREADRVILFADVTWSYDLNTNNWSVVDTLEQPLARFGAAMAYDSQSDRMALFGGSRHTQLAYSHPGLNDTWLLEVPVAAPQGQPWISALVVAIVIAPIAAGAVAVYVALARRRQRERKPPAPPSSPPGD